MKIPPQATGVVVYYGEVYIESPSYPDDTRESWSVWDPRPVRQGARCIGDKLSFRAAEALALQADKPPSSVPLVDDEHGPCKVCKGSGRVMTGTISVTPMGPTTTRCLSCNGAGRVAR